MNAEKMPEMARGETEANITVKNIEQSAAQSKKGSSTHANIIYLAVKRLADIILSALALILLSPLMLVLALMVKLEDGGPVIHHRACVKKGGGTFIMYKFRSMKTDADKLENYMTPEQIAQYKKEIKLDNDPRITKCGKKLRKYSLDELPQLLNILKGDMSIVGPRPIIPEETFHYGDKIDDMLSAKPGLTGYWQVHGRSTSTYERGERQRLELYYAYHRNLWLDIKIFFMTFFVVITGKGAM